MSIFLLIWILMLGAAGGLAIGSLWGRKLEKGSCARSAETGHPSVACQGCTPIDRVRRRAPECDG